MNTRLAKKIVSRVRSGSVTHKSYPLAVVRRAFKQESTALPPALLSPWADEDARRKQALEDAPLRAKQAQTRREAAAQRVADRRQAKVDNIERAKADVAHQRVAAAAAQEAFRQTMEAKDAPAEVTVAVTAEEPAEEPSYADLKVGELKALCKEQGLKGYSKLKRDDLMELLKGGAG
jgi:hypothetical protein